MRFNLFQPRWRRQVKVRLMPWFAGAVLIVSLLYALALLILVGVTVSFYAICALTVVAVVRLTKRWKKLFRFGAK